MIIIRNRYTFGGERLLPFTELVVVSNKMSVSTKCNMKTKPFFV